MISFLTTKGWAQSIESTLDSDLNGAKWKKTLRIRGIMKPFDYFSETNMYNIKNAINQDENIGSDKELIHFENVASNFWIGLRDSLQLAIQNNEVDVYIVEESDTPDEEGIFVKSVKVSYNDLLNDLSNNMAEIVNNYGESESRYVYNLNTMSAMLYKALEPSLRNTESNNENIPANQLVKDLGIISLYELELELIVSETGFRVKPKSILFSTAHWDAANMFNSPLFARSPARASVPIDQIDPDDFSGFSGGFARGVGGFLIDLSEEKTLDYLVEHGIQISGENNIIPFYDLITLFHYDYKIYSESNKVLAQGASRLNYELQELEKTMLNRYNDMTYTYLYGQPPQWWENGKKGRFTNGLFEYQIPEKDDEDNNENEAGEEGTGQANNQNQDEGQDGGGNN